MAEIERDPAQHPKHAPGIPIVVPVSFDDIKAAVREVLEERDRERLSAEYSEASGRLARFEGARHARAVMPSLHKDSPAADVLAREVPGAKSNMGLEETRSAAQRLILKTKQEFHAQSCTCARRPRCVPHLGNVWASLVQCEEHGHEAVGSGSAEFHRALHAEYCRCAEAPRCVPHEGARDGQRPTHPRLYYCAEHDHVALPDDLASLEHVLTPGQVQAKLAGAAAGRITGEAIVAAWKTAVSAVTSLDPDEKIEDSLGMAWAAAEALVPAGYRLDLTWPYATRGTSGLRYHASCRSQTDYLGFIGYNDGGETPAEALHALEMALAKWHGRNPGRLR